MKRQLAGFLLKSHVRSYTRTGKSGKLTTVNEFERDAAHEGRRPTVMEFLHGKEHTTAEGVHGHFKYTPRVCSVGREGFAGKCSCC